MHGLKSRETSFSNQRLSLSLSLYLSIYLSLSLDRFSIPSFGRRAAAARLGEFDINPRWKPADDRLDLALINRVAASRSIDVDDLFGIHARYISPEHLAAR